MEFYYMRHIATKQYAAPLSNKNGFALKNENNYSLCFLRFERAIEETRFFSKFSTIKINRLFLYFCPVYYLFSSHSFYWNCKCRFNHQTEHDKNVRNKMLLLFKFGYVFISNLKYLAIVSILLLTTLN